MEGTVTKRESFKSITISLLGILITSLIFMAISFLLYYLLFTLIETAFNNDKTYSFVSIIRIGIGILIFILFILVNRSKANRIIKSSLFCCAISVILIGIGVQLHEYQIMFYITTIVLYLICVFVLIVRKKEWVYYYSLGLAIIPVFMYL